LVGGKAPTTRPTVSRGSVALPDINYSHFLASCESRLGPLTAATVTAPGNEAGAVGMESLPVVSQQHPYAREGRFLPGRWEGLSTRAGGAVAAYGRPRREERAATMVSLMWDVEKGFFLDSSGRRRSGVSAFRWRASPNAGRLAHSGTGERDRSRWLPRFLARRVGDVARPFLTAGQWGVPKPDWAPLQWSRAAGLERTASTQKNGVSPPWLHHLRERLPFTRAQSWRSKNVVGKEPHREPEHGVYGL